MIGRYANSYGMARQGLEENRELRLVSIPDATSGDLRMRVGTERFWNALDLLPSSDEGEAAMAASGCAASSETDTNQST